MQIRREININITLSTNVFKPLLACYFYCLLFICTSELSLEGRYLKSVVLYLMYCIVFKHL